MPREFDEVVLVDAAGRPSGTHRLATVHTRDTQRHLAFSCWIRDASGAVLMTRRALTKVAWPGVWTNSCCGHPRPAESVRDAVNRRVGEELGVEITELECVLPDFSYRAGDASGIVEHELCPVFVATIADSAVLRPDPAEVMDWGWHPPSSVMTAAQVAPYAFSPWAVLQLRQLPAGALGNDVEVGV